MVVLFVLYGLCCQQGVSGSDVCGSYIAFALYCQQADENVYKNVMDILILSVPIVGIPCYFFFGRPELTSKTQKRMARIVEAYAPLRPENELLNETLRQTDMDAYRQSRLITQNQKYPLYAEDCTEYFNQVRRLLRAF